MTVPKYRNCWYMWVLKTYHIFSNRNVNTDLRRTNCLKKGLRDKVAFELGVNMVCL